MKNLREKPSLILTMPTVGTLYTSCISEKRAKIPFLEGPKDHFQEEFHEQQEMRAARMEASPLIHALKDPSPF